MARLHMACLLLSHEIEHLGLWGVHECYIPSLNI